MKKRMLWILAGGFVLLLVVSSVLLWGGVWLERKLELVRRGDARPEFPFKEYTESDLRAIMPFAFQDALDHVPTRTPPEVTLQRFLDAMKRGDIDAAANQFMEKEREGWKEDLLEIQKAGMVKRMIEDLSTAKQTYKSDSIAWYNYAGRNGKERVEGQIDFQKNTQGDWKIKDL